MPCTPLSISTGFFIHTNWTTAPSSSSNGRSVSLTSSGLTATGPGGSVFHGTAGDNVTKYMFFGDGHLLVLERETSAPASVWVSLIDFTGASPDEVPILFGSIDGPSTNDPVVQVSQGAGNAFLIYSSTGGGPLGQIQNLSIYRSSNGDILCPGPPPFNATGETLGEATASQLIIHYNTASTNYQATSDLPSGECTISPRTLSFSERVIGGPASLATATLNTSLRNTGDDCLTISGIASSGPYTTNFSGSVVLGPGESHPVQVTFTPTAVGTFNGVNLAVTRSPARGDAAIVCNGRARAAVTSLSLSASSLAFGTHPVASTSTRSLTLTNDGDLPVSFSIAAGSGVFTWSALSQTLAVGASATVTVTFQPSAVGPHGATLIVESPAPGFPRSVTLSGAGCVATPEIGGPSGPLGYGEVQQGFRTVRYVIVSNPGSGNLTFRARITGADAALFGLQLDNGSITDLEPERSYQVAPVTPCGSFPAGSGQAVVAVGFFANQAPSSVSAELIIDDHNAGVGFPASFTVNLSATIVQPVDVDAALVLDRSGSMAATVGARTKSEACIASGRLFVQLLRADVQDRIATVKYNANVDVLQDMVLLSTGNPGAIAGQLNSSELSPTGMTSIAGGLLAGLKEIAKPRATPSPQVNKLIVVLTDGQDNSPYLNPDDGRHYSILGGTHTVPPSGSIDTQPVPVPADVKVYAVGLGKSEEIDVGRLNALAQASGAYLGVVNQDLEGSRYFDLEKYFTQIFMDAVELSAIHDPVATIHPNQTHRVPFEVLRGDVGGLVVVYDKNPAGRLPFYLETPGGAAIDLHLLPPGFQVRHGVTDTARFVEFKCPLGQPDAYAGTWHLVVQHKGELCRPPQLRDRKGNREEAAPGFVTKACQQYQEPVDYGFAIGVGSNFRMQAYVSPQPLYVGDAIRLTSVVSEAGLRVTGCTVTVRATSPSGAVTHLTLVDDGLHEDGEANDGEYARLFTATHESGGYEFVFRAAGQSRDGEPVVREAVRSKYVLRPGDELVPGPRTPPLDRGKDDCCRSIQRLIWIGLILLLLILIVLLRAAARG